MTPQPAPAPTYMARMIFKVSRVTTNENGSKEIMLVPQSDSLVITDVRFPGTTAYTPFQLFIGKETGSDPFILGASFYVDVTLC